MKPHDPFQLLLACVLLAGLALAQTGKQILRPALGLPAPKEQNRQLSPNHPQPGLPTAVNFGTIDFPGASDSSAYRINDLGQMVGGYGADLEVDIGDTGFLLNHGAFKSIRFPGAIRTQASGINNLGEIVGTYIDSATNYHAFKLVKGVYTNIDFPGAYISQASAVNDSGEIAGLYYDAQLNSYGFSLVGSTYTSFQFPGAIYTFPLGLNNPGVIVGTYVDTAGTYHGFSLTGTNFTTIDYPGAVFSEVAGINDTGNLVGMWGDGDLNNYEGFQHGFAVYGGQYLNIDAPFVGVGSTWVVGINRFNQIVGLYIDSAFRFFGYTAKLTP